MDTTSEKKPVALPWVAGISCTISLYLIGLSAPALTQMFRDFRVDPFPIPIVILSYIHWAWTLPLGLSLAAFLIWGSRHWSRRVTITISVSPL